MRIKKLSIAFSCLILLSVLTGCAGNLQTLDEGYRIKWLKKGDVAPFDGWLIERGLYNDMLDWR